MKKVSILTSVYNGKEYMGPYFEAILSQTTFDFQLIIVDDGSTDETPSIIEKYKSILESKGIELVLLKNQKNIGLASSINEGLKYVDSQYFMWLDADDLLLPNTSIEQRIDFMESHPELDLCVCDATWLEYPDYGVIKGTMQKQNKNYNYFFDILKMEDVLWVPGSVFVKTSFFQKAIPDMKIYDNHVAQNIQLLLPLFYKGKYEYTNTALYTVVARKNSDSRQKLSNDDQRYRYYQHHLALMATIDHLVGITREEKIYYYKIAQDTLTVNNMLLSYKNKSYKDGKKLFNQIMLKERKDAYKHIVKKYWLLSRFKRKIKALSSKIYKKVFRKQ